MNKTLIAIILITPTSCLNTSNTGMEKKNKPKNEQSVKKDSTPKVTGIGGIFFYSENPQ